ncbi:MAG: phosphoribosylaminoimidazolesuccinocarboxamide synthase [Methanomicrobiales archaeon]|nr:phosphoribosylaminoimidazolesuccinocarboxamide synthase [Methanomicrobiales archaeon]MDI6875383.1 phosphoribosylaminoimidazolesuccinocarboxamide synthase [Methanomicrobiales archaeon]
MKMGKLLRAGKAKSVYRSDSDDRLIMEFRDDITAFDGTKKDVLPRKGELNAAVSAYVFEYLEARGIPTHYIRMLDERRMLVRNLEMIPLEVIVRNIAAGSLVKRYPIAEGTPLDPPVIIIDYKDDSRHDPMLNDDLILALRILDRRALDRVRELSLEINRLLSEHFKDKGLTLVDFKMEFGRWRGEIVLGDEISMDSMRLWDTVSGESMDKDVYRFGKGDVISAYAAVAGRIVPGTSGGGK